MVSLEKATEASLPEDRSSEPGVSLQRIFLTWWPLAASWLLMGIELPALSAFVARLPEPEINLAAYGGVVFPLALIVESPIIMLLAASTALSKDWASYQKLHRFMMVAGAALTLLHILVAFTPLYNLVVVRLLGVPAEIVEPARVGLRIMTPWTWSIAYRRFQQGVLIRFGHSRSVGSGTVVRLATDIAVLAVGFSLRLPGIVVGTSAVAAGVMAEAAFAGWAVRPVLRDQVRLEPPAAEAVTLRSFLDFYIPLAMTSLLTLLANPIGSAAMSRMPTPLDSLAVWPVVSGPIFMIRSVGIAYNEVVVALLDQARSAPLLKRFAWLLAGAGSLIMVIVAATPLAALWFSRLQALPPDLARMARIAMWLALPLPALSVAQSWFQGAMLHHRRTRGISEAVVVYLVASAVILGAGVALHSITGLYVGMVGLVGATLVQTVWLGVRSQEARRAVEDRK